MWRFPVQDKVEVVSQPAHVWNSALQWLPFILQDDDLLIKCPAERKVRCVVVSNLSTQA
jgi:hypothetical protein